MMRLTASFRKTVKRLGERLLMTLIKLYAEQKNVKIECEVVSE